MEVLFRAGLDNFVNCLDESIDSDSLRDSVSELLNPTINGSRDNIVHFTDLCEGIRWSNFVPVTVSGGSWIDC